MSSISKVSNLISYLTTFFFTDNSSDFQIIYDEHGFLKTFFETEKSDHENVNILIVDSTQQPSEFILRKQIVADFDETEGWYKHKWIIYIYGQYTFEIENFQSFLYYSRLGKWFKFDSLLDLLFNLPNSPMSSKKTNFILEMVPELNKIVFPHFLTIPLDCFISKNGELSEAAIWMAYLTSLSSDSNYFRESSPIWNERVNTNKLFTIGDVILELIRFIDPSDSYSIEETPKFLIYLFKFISDSLNAKQILDISVSFDENLKRLILYLYELVTQSKVKKKEKKGASLESYLTDTKVKTKKLAIQIFNSWVNHSDKLLCERFQQWMGILRKELPLVSITENNLAEYQKLFSFTGTIDISIMRYLLEKQLKSLMSLNEWNTTLEDIIKKRGGLWRKHGGLWWNEKSLFKTLSYSASISEIWQLIKAIGRVFSYKINSSSWLDLELQAWKIEKNSHALYNPRTREIILHIESFQSMKEFYLKATSQNEELIQQINTTFTDYYLNQMINEPDNFLPDIAKDLFEEMIQDIKDNEEIGIIFCDALRKDLSMVINEHLQERFRRAKNIVKAFDIQSIASITYIPSNTAIGWNSILSFSDHTHIVYKYNNGEIELLFSDKKEKTTHLRTREDREKRLACILRLSGKPIEIIPLNSRNIFTELRHYQEKVVENKTIFYVPIVWYSKIDDHEKTRDDFFENIDEYLTEIEDMIYQFHTNGVKHVYIFVDHGFIFAKDEYVLEKGNRPKGDLHFRYCISQQRFTQQETNKFKDWCVIDPIRYNIKILDDPKKVPRSIITPRGYKTFNKIGSKTKFIHGGLSFQENSINLMKSYCEIYPSVKIELFEPFNHHSYTDSGGELIYELKKIQNFHLFEIRVKGSKSLVEEKQKPIRIKLICDNPSIEVVPKGNKILKSGSEIIYRLSFPEKIILSQISVSIVDSQNLLLAKKLFKLRSILYTTGFEDF